jgi:hypothetical protein
MSDIKRERFKWLALFTFSFGLFLFLVVSSALYHSTSFADRLVEIFGRSVSDTQRLAVALTVGLVVELVFLVLAYLLLSKISPKKSER